MSLKSTPPYRFGDLLALARQSWVRQMASGLNALGYLDYRRSDAAVMRLLQRGPLSIGRLGEALGVTRQAARKVADGLERRGLAVTARDEQDSRQVNIVLTPGGEAYARAVVAVIDRLNEELRQRVDPDQLMAADAVLRVVLHDDRSRRRAAGLAPPPLHSAEAMRPGPGAPP
ncbi:MAG: MarR family transcriptional regulator [Actinomycetota bacterium]|nr:MarR family transcriptional regulator [Actinomycetota bacterium]